MQCHPDKNPDNPKAAQLFLQLSKILAVLTDKAARVWLFFVYLIFQFFFIKQCSEILCLQAAYDKLVNAKIAAKLREKEYDSKRKKLIDNLVQRERMAMGQQKDSVERNFEVKIHFVQIHFYNTKCINNFIV